MHLTCRKFHDLASMIPCQLSLTTVLSSEENVKAFKKSSQIYDRVYLIEFGTLSDIQFLPAITLLGPTGVYVKELRIHYGYLNKFDVVTLLHLFPNLEILSLQDIYPKLDSSQEQRGIGAISLPKLTDITIGDDDDTELYDLVKDFPDSSITGLDIRSRQIWRINQKIVDFIKKQEKSLKRLHLDLFPDNPDDWNFLGDLEEMRLEGFELSNYRDNRGNRGMLLGFLRQNGLTLKYLSLTVYYLTDKMLEVICDASILEKLRLDGKYFFVSRGFLALQKLKKLKKLRLFSLVKKNILEGLATVVNENMLEIVAPLDDTSAEFIARLAICLPNLRKIYTATMSASQVKAVLKHFPNLKDLTIYVPEDSQKASKKILKRINKHGKNLSNIKLFGCTVLTESLVRDKLKDRQGLLVSWHGHNIEI